jgi:hypothetical protein
MAIETLATSRPSILVNPLCLLSLPSARSTFASSGIAAYLRSYSLGGLALEPSLVGAGAGLSTKLVDSSSLELSSGYAMIEKQIQLAIRATLRRNQYHTTRSSANGRLTFGSGSRK